MPSARQSKRGPLSSPMSASRRSFASAQHQSTPTALQQRPHWLIEGLREGANVQSVLYPLGFPAAPRCSPCPCLLFIQRHIHLPRWNRTSAPRYSSGPLRQKDGKRANRRRERESDPSLMRSRTLWGVPMPRCGARLESQALCSDIWTPVLLVLAHYFAVPHLHVLAEELGRGPLLRNEVRKLPAKPRSSLGSARGRSGDRRSSTQRMAEGQRRMRKGAPFTTFLPRTTHSSHLGRLARRNSHSSASTTQSHVKGCLKKGRPSLEGFPR